MSHSTSIGVKGRLFRAVENATRGLIYAGMVKPVPTAFVPVYGYEGMRYHGTITGTNLGTVTAVSLGTGITIESFEIDSNTQISVIFRTDANGAAGYRDLSVYRGAIVGVLSNAFELIVSDALIEVPSKKKTQQRMEMELVAKAVVQYPYGRQLGASVKVQRIGVGVLPAQATLQHAYDQPLGGQVVVQLRTSQLMDTQVQIHKMADIAGISIVRDGVFLSPVGVYSIGLVDDIELSLGDDLSVTLIDEVISEENS